MLPDACLLVGRPTRANSQSGNKNEGFPFGSCIHHKCSEDFKPCQSNNTPPLVSRPTGLLSLELCTKLALTHQCYLTLACWSGDQQGRIVNQGTRMKVSHLVRVYTISVRKILNPVNPTSRHRWSPDQRARSALSYVRSWP
jgi:hypothetical protein